MSIRSATLASIVLFAGLAIPALAARDAIDVQPGGQGQWVHGCFGDETGALSGGKLWTEVPPILMPEGDSGQRATNENRLDLVIVGDGYTAGELAQYDADVSNVINNFFIYEPFVSYEPYFLITKVDVISNESGVDNDPSPGINRDTALDMTFWCSGIERLLCVNVSKAYAEAFGGSANVDQVLAIANSSKYGGAGYSSSNLGTLSGQNSASVEVAIHEMGHSLGDLADEYTYGGDTNWPGGEPNEPNNSIYDAPTMNLLQTKWWQWEGDADSRFDSPVGHYVGAHYSQFGIYRPSNNSNMRALYRKFNAPSAESLIVNIYRHVTPIDGYSPGNLSPLTGSEIVTVSPMQPFGHNLTVSWTLDGAPIPGVGDQTSIDLSTLSLSGLYALVATVVDPTDMVRNESLRDTFLTETVSWTIDAAACTNPADINGDGVIDVLDFFAFIVAFDNGDPAADLDGNGVIDVLDFFAFVSLFNDGCP